MTEDHDFFSEYCKMEFMVAEAKMNEVIHFDEYLKMDKELNELKEKYKGKAETKIDFIRLKQKIYEHEQKLNRASGDLKSAKEKLSKYLIKRELGKA